MTIVRPEIWINIWWNSENIKQNYKYNWSKKVIKVYVNHITRAWFIKSQSKYISQSTIPRYIQNIITFIYCHSSFDIDKYILLRPLQMCHVNIFSVSLISLLVGVYLSRNCLHSNKNHTTIRMDHVSCYMANLYVIKSLLHSPTISTGIILHRYLCSSSIKCLTPLPVAVTALIPNRLYFYYYYLFRLLRLLLLMSSQNNKETVEDMFA